MPYICVKTVRGYWFVLQNGGIPSDTPTIHGRLDDALEHGRFQADGRVPRTGSRQGYRQLYESRRMAWSRLRRLYIQSCYAQGKADIHMNGRTCRPDRLHGRRHVRHATQRREFIELRQAVRGYPTLADSPIARTRPCRSPRSSRSCLSG